MLNSNLTGCVPAGNEGHGLTYIAGRKKSKIRLNRKDDIRMRRIYISLKTVRFSNYSFNPIPFHRPPDLSVYTYADSAATICVCTANQSETLAVQSFSLTINPFKFPTLTNQGML